MKEFLFVYGTLRKGFEPPIIAETASKLKFFNEGFIYAKLYDLGEYTGIILGGNEKIFGEILELPNDEKVLQKLDEYEGFELEKPSKSLFLRKKTIAYFGVEKLETWVYEYNQNLLSL